MSKIFDRNDPFYYGEEAFGLIHYRNAAIIGAILGMITLSVIVFSSIILQTVYEITGLWSTVFVLLIAVSVFITNILMIYGIVSENSKIMLPQMATLQIETVVLILIAILSIFSMSCGLSVTNYVFNFFINVEKTEKNFGPIWPFNISALAFVGSLACIWFQAIVKGAYEYILDKNYFDSLNISNINIEMVNKTSRK
uniref:MARVEL domain-containing protein n=1 Tax=Strongyloides papillosus TaxID=174720 RepID=A0A0N5C5C3_STREA